MIEALARGAPSARTSSARSALPARVERSGVTVLVYRTADGTEVRLGFGPACSGPGKSHRGAERELSLRSPR